MRNCNYCKDFDSFILFLFQFATRFVRTPSWTYVPRDSVSQYQYLRYEIGDDLRFPISDSLFFALIQEITTNNYNTLQK